MSQSTQEILDYLKKTEAEDREKRNIRELSYKINPPPSQKMPIIVKVKTIEIEEYKKVSLPKSPTRNVEENINIAPVEIINEEARETICARVCLIQ